MQGYTDHTFRMALHRCFGGVDTMFTPFMRLEGGKLRRCAAATSATCSSWLPNLPLCRKFCLKTSMRLLPWLIPLPPQG